MHHRTTPGKWVTSTPVSGLTHFPINQNLELILEARGRVTNRFRLSRTGSFPRHKTDSAKTRKVSANWSELAALTRKCGVLRLYIGKVGNCQDMKKRLVDMRQWK